jgi:hypothetical protein
MLLLTDIGTDTDHTDMSLWEAISSLKRDASIFKSVLDYITKKAELASHKVNIMKHNVGVIYNKVDRDVHLCPLVEELGQVYWSTKYFDSRFEKHTRADTI